MGTPSRFGCIQGRAGDRWNLGAGHSRRAVPYAHTENILDHNHTDVVHTFPPHLLSGRCAALAPVLGHAALFLAVSIHLVGLNVVSDDV